MCLSYSIKSFLVFPALFHKILVHDWRDPLLVTVKMMNPPDYDSVRLMLSEILKSRICSTDERQLDYWKRKKRTREGICSNSLPDVAGWTEEPKIYVRAISYDNPAKAYFKNRAGGEAESGAMASGCT